MKWCAVLIDIVSIQRYVFGSNRLKENLGASYLVENIYDSHMKEVLSLWFSGVDLDSWEKSPEKKFDEKQPVWIGYIGGGNALLFFRNKEKAKEFIYEWTKRLLIHAPGLTTAIALTPEFDVDDTKFKSERKRLFDLLAENKSSFTPQTIISRHGFTDECRSSSLSMEIWQSFKAENGYEEDRERSCYVSSLTHAKIDAAKEAKDALHIEFAHLLEDYYCYLEDKYCFTDELDKLGQSRHEDNQIAIVHIDGNDIASRFREAETLFETRNLSISLKKAIKNSFVALLEDIKGKIDKIEEEFKIKKETSGKYKDRTIIPVLPIIRGGDDITFVCPGRLGIYLAKRFLEFFEKQPISTDGNNKQEIPHDACAGIAIVNTKYPFYRGYELSAALCKEAKKVRREKEKGSWLDFQVAYAGITGTLEEIRDKHFKVTQGDLLIRPYRIKGSGTTDFETFRKNTCRLLWCNPEKKEVNFPRSKLMELRKVLTLGENYTKSFMMKMKEKGVRFDNLILEPAFKENLFRAGIDTPYFDMIELAEYYPEFELKAEEGDSK